MQAGLRDIRLGEYRAAGPGTPSEAQDADTRIEDGIADYRRAAAEFEKLRATALAVCLGGQRAASLTGQGGTGLRSRPVCVMQVAAAMGAAIENAHVAEMRDNWLSSVRSRP